MIMHTRTIMSKTEKNMKTWVERALDELNVGLYERKHILATTLLTVLSGQSVFLYGPPGTAKSLISRRISCVFSDSVYFEYLMQRFSTPEEIFGPVNIAELRKNNYVRDTENYLPTADIAFLDEIWKSSPAILNTLLTIINERKFRNGKSVEQVPLKALIAASNEFPQKDSGLDALYDRFIMRLNVDPLTDQNDFIHMISDNRVESFVKISEPITNKEWMQLMDSAHSIPLSKDTVDAIGEIRKQIDSANAASQGATIYISDRRWQKAIYVLKMAALLSGRSEVWPIDLTILCNSLWSSKDDKEIIERIIRDAIMEIGSVSSSDYAKWNKDYQELKEETKDTFKESTAKKTFDHKGTPCYIARGKVTRTNNASYGRHQVDCTYYFPANIAWTNGGCGTADTDGYGEYPFSINSFDNNGNAYVSINNQSVTLDVSPPVPKVNERVKKTYIKAIQGVIQDLDDIIDAQTKEIEQRKKKLATPFVSESDVDMILKKMNVLLDEMKKDRIDAEETLSVVNGYATE